MMTPEDFAILRTARSILVRNYVDTQKVDVDVIHRTVYIQGEFMLYDTAKQKDPDLQAAAEKRALLIIEREIRRLSSADYVIFQLKNWQRTGARWMRRRADGLT
jgi:hypothetical protein